ncbi:MAG TPA: hypothetical protein VFR14_14055 [Candidatus Limnocylindrales bacterium]|nr:hypothetical protein [Candidatus Limnocylindrales bacterium]
MHRTIGPFDPGRQDQGQAAAAGAMLGRVTPATRSPRRRTAPRASIAWAVGLSVLISFGAAPAFAAEPEPTPTADPAAEPTADPAAEPTATPTPTPEPTPPPTPDPTPEPTPPPAPTPEPTPTPAPTPTPTPEPPPAPTPSPAPLPPPEPTPPPAPAPTPAPTWTRPAVAPAWLNLYSPTSFLYQDPNPHACTATATQIMLNIVAATGSGGSGFAWLPTTDSATRDALLAWERGNDTLPAGRGSDPHGWRNALNAFGWGGSAQYQGNRVYEDVAYPTFDAAVKDAVRALILTGKPVGILGWRGRHAQFITGYYGLRGDPFARNRRGGYTNAFRIGGFYLTDPLASSGIVNRRVSYGTLRNSRNGRVRFAPYFERDSRLDDPYTAGARPSWREWYRRYVVILPVR